MLWDALGKKYDGEDSPSHRESDTRKLYCGVLIHLAGCSPCLGARSLHPSRNSISSITDARGAASLESLMSLSAIRSLLRLFQISPSRRDSGRQEPPHTTISLPGICLGLHTCGCWRSPEGLRATLYWEACSVVAKERIRSWGGH